MTVSQQMLSLALRGYALMVFFVLWAIIGWQDWLQQRIKHRHLFYGTVALCLAYGLILLNFILGLKGKSFAADYGAYCHAMVTHVILCAIASLALWLMRIWPAGDAKLFVFLAFLYPLMNIPRPFPQERMFLIVLMNTFIPAAIFLCIRAGFYVFHTRMRSFRDFLIGLGWRMEFDYFRAMTRGVIVDFISFLNLKAAELRAMGFAETSAAGYQSLKHYLPVLLQWVMGMALMSFVSYYLRNFFQSPILLSLLCMGMFFLWSRLCMALGPALARFLLASFVLVLFHWFPPSNWASLGIIFGNITIFSLFMFLGINWMMRLLSGKGAALVGMLLPLTFSILVFIVIRIEKFMASVGTRAISLFHIGGLTLRVRLGAGAAAINPHAATVLSLALLGLFFGLSLVLVRKWDEEVRPSHTRDALSSFLVLDPSFIERIRQDTEFYNAHFQRIYADGLTAEQAQALKEWCGKNSIDAVPLAPTISFASWIFFGFFLSWLLRNNHLLQWL